MPNPSTYQPQMTDPLTKHLWEYKPIYEKVMNASKYFIKNF